MTGFDYKVRYEATDIYPKGDPQMLLSIWEINLPILIWRNLSVNYEKAEKLTLLKKFILESAIQMEVFTASDIEEITSIPDHAIKRILIFMKRIGLLTQLQDGQYSPIKEKVTQSLSEDAYKISEPKSVPFIYLPETDDLIICESSMNVQLASFDRLKPALSYPIDVNISKNTVHDFVNERIKARQVINLPDEVISVVMPSQSSKISNPCSAFHCNGYIKHDPQNNRQFAELRIYDAGLRQRTPLTLRIDWPSKLISKWTDISDKALSNDYTPALSKAIGLEKKMLRSQPKREGINLYISLDSNEAEEVYAKHSLAEPLGIVIQVEDFARFEFAVFMTPDDKEAANVFITDTIIQSILHVPLEEICLEQIHKVANDTLAQFNLAEVNIDKTVENVLKRMWSIGHYKEIYKLREKEDFLAYA